MKKMTALTLIAALFLGANVASAKSLNNRLDRLGGNKESQSHLLCDQKNTTGTTHRSFRLTYSSSGQDSCVVDGVLIAVTTMQIAKLSSILASIRPAQSRGRSLTRRTPLPC